MAFKGVQAVSAEAPFSIFYSNRARRDLRDVAESYQGPRDPQAVVREIISDIDSLAIFPHRTIVPDQMPVNPPVRSLPVGPYMVYFTADDSKSIVMVLRIRHGARRPLKGFR